ncbi:hypothetical protein AVEN_14904-1 [Araneus ventricosus]|uniref:Uncharacterized protein n=1 Tax=Araneus ventricosus TaxID=182803 RepID=A0A4Y2M4A6_ARAVE|nr:hypothetical protein AVEN_14904-1 [Araneus ventricosus]
MLNSYRRTLPELQPGSSVFVQNRVNQNFTGSEAYSTSYTIPDSTPTVKPQEPVDEPASDFQFRRTYFQKSRQGSVSNQIRQSCKTT